MSFIRRQIREATCFMKESVMKNFYLLLFVFVISIAIVSFVCYKMPDLANPIVQLLQTLTADIAPDDTINYGLLVLNNLRASLVACVSGIVPFLFLPIFSYIMNFIVIGAIIGSVLTQYNLFQVVVCGILPHGIFEIPAIILSISMGIALCLTITKRIFGRKDASIMYAIRSIIVAFIIYVLPLMLIAGAIEAYLTPIIIEKFI